MRGIDHERRSPRWALEPGVRIRRLGLFEESPEAGAPFVAELRHIGADELSVEASVSLPLGAPVEVLLTGVEPLLGEVVRIEHETRWVGARSERCPRGMTIQLSPPAAARLAQWAQSAPREPPATRGWWTTDGAET